MFYSIFFCKGFTEVQTHIRSAEPDVPHVVTDGFGSRHCAGEFPGLDDSCTSLLHRLPYRNEKTYRWVN